ncbi:MAG: DUF1266 domain-containing protein [Coriobacteriia bacterium]|nr:DUF1266 domain-containing protein [Coriobacteriia bacterium]
MKKAIATLMVFALITTLLSGCVGPLRAPSKAEEGKTQQEKPAGSQQNNNLSMEPAIVESWAIGCSAILATKWGVDPHNYGMFDKNDKDAAATARTVLSRDWGISSRADLIELIERMTDGGHSSEFAEVYEAVASLSDAEYAELLEYAEGIESYMWPLTKSLGEKWGDRQIKAWDWFRMIHIIGWGYHAGYLELEEAYSMMIPVIERLSSTFSSWDEANENYLDGYAWWSMTDVGDPNSEYKNRVKIYESLKDDSTLYNPLLWQ